MLTPLCTVLDAVSVPLVSWPPTPRQPEQLRLTELPVTLSKAYHMPQERLNFRYRCVISVAFIL